MQPAGPLFGPGCHLMVEFDPLTTSLSGVCEPGSALKSLLGTLGVVWGIDIG